MINKHIKRSSENHAFNKFVDYYGDTADLIFCCAMELKAELDEAEDVINMLVDVRRRAIERNNEMRLGLSCLNRYPADMSLKDKVEHREYMQYAEKSSGERLKNAEADLSTWHPIWKEASVNYHRFINAAIDDYEKQEASKQTRIIKPEDLDV